MGLDLRLFMLFGIACSELIAVNCVIPISNIEKNEMGGACGAYGGGERCAQGSGGET